MAQVTYKRICVFVLTVKEKIFNWFRAYWSKWKRIVLNLPSTALHSLCRGHFCRAKWAKTQRESGVILGVRR